MKFLTEGKLSKNLSLVFEFFVQKCKLRASGVARNVNKKEPRLSSLLFPSPVHSSPPFSPLLTLP